MEIQKQKFQALSRICLNNWHYIDRRVLSFHEGINFFTGHSGSGKSTVIDALQILLYANTDGRGFFNKAAADDSDRTLMEYLRGMVNIGENNEFSYLRNKNFSATIVMELQRTDTGEYQSIGVVFDVEPATNEVVSRLFFWHKGPLLESGYRTTQRAMSTEEIKDHLQNHYEKSEYYFGPSNERFRRQLYDVYLGGLNVDRFPLLFKRAIPFKMNIKLEEFVKEYICLEEDIHIEDMQESVMQYGRMRKKIEDTRLEIQELEKIRMAYGQVLEKEEEKKRCGYFMNAMELRKLKELIAGLQIKINAYEEDRARQQREIDVLDGEIGGLESRAKELIGLIASTGYQEIQNQLMGVHEILERLSASRGKWQQTASRLKAWEEQEITPNPVLWNIQRFEKGSISQEQIRSLKEALEGLRQEVKIQSREAQADIRRLREEEKEILRELKELRQGRKAYPKELEEARKYIQQGLKEQEGRVVPVEILADLLDIRDDSWRNAVEGYLGNNKLLLMVDPPYARQAMDLYKQLDRQKFHRVAVLDTERVMGVQKEVRQGALCEEVATKVPHARSYIDFLLGGVIKCDTIDELRTCKIGITRDGMQYHSFKLQYINPDHYTRRAYIGEVSMKKRSRRLEEQKEDLNRQLEPLLRMEEACKKILALEHLTYEEREYLDWKSDIDAWGEKEKEKEGLRRKLNTLKEKNVEAWEREKDEAEALARGKQKLKDGLLGSLRDTQNKINGCKAQHLDRSQELVQKEQELPENKILEQAVAEYLSEKQSPNYERLQAAFAGRVNGAAKEAEDARSRLRDIRYRYLRTYPNRSFSPEAGENREYDELLEHLQYADLEQLQKKAGEQAKDAVELFKQDFIYKIRSAIREAFNRRDELNQIISGLNFGKDKYQFVITKNKGADGKYFDMFMDENLEVNPAWIGDRMENQMNLFTMSHEDKYGELMNELIGIFIPPDNAGADELEEARRNMERYADYRTYLSFDMSQIIEGEETIRIRLSKMIKKNSGGEGQNPLYVALLASFAQAYRINLTPKLMRTPTIRLVVLDEAFSKMDAEKVASCIALIRGLGFQAIISATNDKIQNYLENVDKTFVFANPRKKHISIQEFEKREFIQLSEEMGEQSHAAEGWD